MQLRMFAVKTWGRMRSETACRWSRFVRPQGGCSCSCGAECSMLLVVAGRPTCRDSNPTGQFLVISGQAPIVFGVR